MFTLILQHEIEHLLNRGLTDSEVKEIECYIEPNDSASYIIDLFEL